MKGYTKNRNKKNLGGLQNTFIFVGEDEVDYFADIIESRLIDVIFIEPDTLPAVIETVQEQSTFTENEEEPGYFRYEIEVKISRDEAGLNEFLKQFIGRKIVTKVIDNNGESRMIGEPGNGAQITANLEKGQQVSELNKYTLNITWEADHRAPFANDIFIVQQDLACSNPIVPSKAATGTTLTTSIDITNYSDHPYPARQTFTLEGLGSIQVEHTIPSGATITFEAVFELPPDYILEN